MKTDKSAERLGGVVYTPDDVAEGLTKLALRRCSALAPSILEPSAGDGAFMRFLCNQEVEIAEVDAVDTDSIATKGLRKNFSNATIYNCDFLDFFFTNPHVRYDVIIGNPPYIRQHNFSDQFKANVDRLALETDFPRFHLKNAWAAFVVAATAMLSDEGVLAFVVPYELVNVKYGLQVQNFLSRNFERVEIFIPEEKAFKEIDQDAVVILAMKKAKRDKGFQIHKVRSLANLRPEETRNVTYAEPENIAVELKSIFFDSKTLELLHKLRKSLKTVNDYADSSAGIVTAANDFFILDADDVKKFRLNKWARKILKKGSFLSRSPVFTVRDLEEVVTTQPAYLIDFLLEGAGPLSVKALSYIQRGEELGINKRYKCSFRDPWYRIPIVPAADGFFFKRSHSFPRLYINEAKVLVTDTAYQVRMKKGHNIRELCFSFYNSLTLLFSEVDGRFYGGGVLELTPSEFRGLPIVYQRPSDRDFFVFLNRFPRSTKVSDVDFSFYDERLRRALQLSEIEMRSIQNALYEVRRHRLRHGSVSQLVESI